MKGRYALVLYPHIDPENGEPVWDDLQDHFIYAKCSGEVHEPTGYYFKWLQFEGDEQTDSRLYLVKNWKIVWIPRPLSDVEVIQLAKDRCLPEFTGSLLV